MFTRGRRLKNYQTHIFLIFSVARTGFPYSVSVEESSSIVDIVGVGLNATDTIIRLPHFPAFNSKVEFRVSEILPGGQVATAVTACARWGLRTRHGGKSARHSSAVLQPNLMPGAGIEGQWLVPPGCASQSSLTQADRLHGGRTARWKLGA